MKHLFKKELDFYFNNPLGYIIVVLFALLANFLFVKDIFAQQSASLKPFFGFIPWLFIILVPAVCMRAFAQEKQSNTIETLLTLPLTEKDIVLAKFFSALVFIAVALALTLGLPISLSFLSTVYLPEVITGYVGLLLLAAAYIAVSLLCSLKTSSQIVAFFVSAVILFLFTASTADFVSSFVPRSFMDQLLFLAPLPNLDNFVKGIVDLRSLVYFISITGIFLFITRKELEKRS
jgi:ABC-2 type transport system permease protein